MQIEFAPQFSNATLNLSLEGNLLVINGEPHDFSAIPVGGSVGNVGQVLSASRNDDGLKVQLVLPHSQAADVSVRFPQPIVVTQNGPIAVPGQDAPEPPRTDVFVVPYNAPPTPTQFELDERRYQRRAAVKDSLLAYMAADNMSRVRSGVWTVPQLVSLLDDPAVVAAQGFMQTLSFELAAQSIADAATPLLTPEIRADWIARLQANFFLVP